MAPGPFLIPPEGTEVVGLEEEGRCALHYARLEEAISEVYVGLTSQPVYQHAGRTSCAVEEADEDPADQVKR